MSYYIAMDAGGTKTETILFDETGHILVRDIPEGAVRRFDRYCAEDYVYLSDHAPVYIDLKL